MQEFLDAGESARSAARPELQAMLRRVALSDIDCVIVHRIDRLARSVPDHFEIKHAMKKAKTELVSVSETIDDTPSGLLVERMMSGIAEFYSANLVAETKREHSRR